MNAVCLDFEDTGICIGYNMGSIAHSFGYRYGISCLFNSIAVGDRFNLRNQDYIIAIIESKSCTAKRIDGQFADGHIILIDIEYGTDQFVAPLPIRQQGHSEKANFKTCAFSFGYRDQAGHQQQ